MADTAKRNISFPRYAEYNCAFKYIVEQALDAKYVMPPPLTKRTMELGTKYSPDFVCTPFKTVLGSMIESLEAGADTLLMTHGLCRLGYYGELLEQILRDLGYHFDFINLSEYDMRKKKGIHPHRPADQSQSSSRQILISVYGGPADGGVFGRDYRGVLPKLRL